MLLWSLISGSQRTLRICGQPFVTRLPRNNDGPSFVPVSGTAFFVLPQVGHVLRAGGDAPTTILSGACHRQRSGQLYTQLDQRHWDRRGICWQKEVADTKEAAIAAGFSTGSAARLGDASRVQRRVQRYFGRGTVELVFGKRLGRLSGWLVICYLHLPIVRWYFICEFWLA